jgi:small subunit ribosomal protein S20
MANTKNAQKAQRQADKRRSRNRVKAKSTRNAIKDLRLSVKKEDALKKLPSVLSMVDKLAKSNIIHKKKANNLKSGLVKKVNALK